MRKWITKHTEQIVAARWVNARRDSVELSNGTSIDDFYAITIQNAVAIMAIDTEGNIILKKEYRYCYGRELIEVSAGTFEV